MACNNGDCLLATVQMQWQGVDIFQSVFHARYTTASPETDDVVMTAVVVGLEAAFSQIDNLQHEDLVYLGTKFYNITQERPMGEQNWYSVPSPAETSEPLPLQCQALALFYTATKRSVGKKFIPAFTVSQVTDGQTLTTSAKVAVQDFADELLTARSTIDGEIAFGNWRDPVTYFIPWTSAVARAGVYTQRRRRLGVGS